MTSKELVKGMFKGDRAGKVPFIPWLSSFAARLEQITPERMFGDPGLLAKATRNAQQLYGHDAVVSIFDPSLEAEACGCTLAWAGGGAPSVISHPMVEGIGVDEIDPSQLIKKGRVPIALEATRQLKLTIGERVAVVAVVTGPLTLAEHLMGGSVHDTLSQDPGKAEKAVSFAARVARELCTRYCELNVDAVAVADEHLGELKPELIRKVGSRLTPIWNITRFYRISSVILTRNAKKEQAEAICGMGADGVVLGTSLSSGDVVRRANQRIGFALPLAVLSGQESDFEGRLSQCLPQTSAAYDFWTTEWDVPADTPVQNMYNLAQVMKRLSTEQR